MQRGLAFRHVQKRLPTNLTHSSIQPHKNLDITANDSSPLHFDFKGGEKK